MTSTMHVPRSYAFSLLVVVVLSTFLTPSRCCNITIGKNGTFSLSAFSDSPWLDSGPVAFMSGGKWLSSADGSLTFVDGSASTKTGQDDVGPYIEYSYRYQAGNISVDTIIRQYMGPAMVVFTQRFPQGVAGSRTDFNKTMSAFPSFQIKDTATPLGYLSFGSFMFGDRIKKFGKFGKGVDINDGMDGSAPFLLFDKSRNALLVSPYDTFMASSMWYDKEAAILNWGIMGGVDSLPAGFEYKTVAMCSDAGIGEVFSGWGQVMKQKYGKTDDVVNYHKSQDLSLTHLGYWTDNGAYFYYNRLANKTYEDTLLAVKENALENRVPYRYMQIDSWFYPKDSMKAVTTWDAMEENFFPAGLNAFQDKLQLPLVAHNRYWSVNATYAKQNGGLFDFIIGKRLALPNEALFWDYLLGHGREEWGLIVYEQDWLNVQTLFTEELNTNLTLGRMWLSQMANAALRRDVKIQYCMALSRHALQSLEFPVVTQARVSNDYLLLEDQWKIGVTSHFAHAMGVAPSKDTFWTEPFMTGNPYDKQEAYPNIQTVVAVLSTGPVGPGDMIRGTNVSMLMRCCDDNGLILKPSVPARAIDDQFLESAFQDGQGAQGEVWSAYSTHQNSSYGIVFAANLSHDYVITPQKAGLLSAFAPKFTESVLYSIPDNTKAVVLDQALTNSSQWTIGKDNCTTNRETFCLFYTSPLIKVGQKQVALLGDVSKWVPMSEGRVVNLWSKADGLAVTLRGREGEGVSLSYYMDNAVATKTGKANDKECVTFTLIQGTEPIYPSDLDCRFKEPPFTTPMTPRTLTTSHHGGGAQGGQLASLCQVLLLSFLTVSWVWGTVTFRL